MMILIKAPNILLEEPVLPFNIHQMDPVPVALDMIDLMNAESGLGLSANQVGLNAQIFVMKAILNKTYGSPLVVINPRIKSISDTRDEGIEGCLSHPGLYLKVKRPISIVAEFETLTDDYKSVINVETKFDDIDARVFLHEYDHLHGIQFINRVSKLKLTMAEKRRKKKEHV
jgi:peptide deformylase|tara:strand:+ start:21 stop:536 length:516 start_codon:yes stop_codon:yes gene_type:complete